MTPIKLEAVCKSLQKHMDDATGAIDVAVGMRRPGSNTPAVVWELTGAEAAILTQGVPGAHWLLTCEVNVFGDTALAVLQDADQIVDYWNNQTSLGAGYAKLVLTGVSVSMRTESQADGSEGDERVCTITMNLQGA